MKESVLMSLAVKILAAACGALSTFFSDLDDLLDPPGPDEHNHDCGPHVMTMADVIAARATRQPEPKDAPSYAKYEWRGAFASEIHNGDLISLDGRHFDGQPGRRALRVTQLRERDVEGHGPEPVKTVTVLFVDLDNNRHNSVTMGQDAAIEIAVEVPDTPEGVFRSGEFGGEG